MGPKKLSSGDPSLRSVLHVVTGDLVTRGGAVLGTGIGNGLGRYRISSVVLRSPALMMPAPEWNFAGPRR